MMSETKETPAEDTCDLQDACSDPEADLENDETTTTTEMRRQDSTATIVEHPCAVCDAKATDDNAISFCDNGCHLCKTCCFSKDIIHALFVDEQDDSDGEGAPRPACELCDGGKLLEDRYGELKFINFVKRYFAPPQIVREYSKSSLAEEDGEHGDKPKQLTRGPTLRIMEYCDSDTESESEDEQSSGKNSAAPVEPKNFYKWSGGTVDIREDDLDDLFGMSPVKKEHETPIYRRFPPSPFTKYVEQVQDDRNNNRIRSDYRRMNLKGLMIEINEIYEQWMIKAKDGHGHPEGIPLADFICSFTFKQYGVKKMADQHLYSLTQGVLQFASHSERITTFAIIIGIFKPEAYTPMISRVLFLLVKDMFYGNPKEFREYLDAGEGEAWIRSDRLVAIVETLFKSNETFKLSMMNSDLDKKRIPRPWSEDAKSSLRLSMARLSQNVAKNKTRGRGGGAFTNMDSFLHFALTAWLIEWTRAISAYDRIIQHEKDLEEFETRNREQILEAANSRPFTPKEEALLRSMCNQVKESLNLTSMPNNGSHAAWEAIAALNLEQKANRKPYLVNRAHDQLSKSWIKLENERIRRERIYWDYTKWEWNDDWEWGGLSVFEPEEPEPVAGDQTRDSAIHIATEGKDQVWVMKYAHKGEFQDSRVENESNEDIHDVKLTKNRLPPLANSRSLDYISATRRKKKREQQLGESKSTIDLRHYHGGNQSVDSLVDTLNRYNDAIGAITVRENNLDDEACYTLLAALKPEHEVVQLDFSKNCCGAKFSALLNSSYGTSLHMLTSLTLTGCKMGNHLVVSLFGALGAETSRVIRLNLSDNELGNSIEFANAWAQFNSQKPMLQELDLSWNKLTSADVSVGLPSLARNRSIGVLNLQFNCIGDKGACSSLAAFIKENRSLIELDVGYNNISHSSCKALGKSLGLNQTLQRLGFNGNPIKEEGAKDLYEATQGRLRGKRNDSTENLKPLVVQIQNCGICFKKDVDEGVFRISKGGELEL